jgi:hypothetical protein
VLVAWHQRRLTFLHKLKVDCGDDFNQVQDNSVSKTSEMTVRIGAQFPHVEILSGITE